VELLPARVDVRRQQAARAQHGAVGAAADRAAYGLEPDATRRLVGRFEDPLPRGTTVGPSSPGTFSIYDWQAAAWYTLDAGTREVALSPAADFVGPDGSVRVQVASGGADKVVRFLPPELTLEGEAGS